ncbi:SDR family oxidoreductase [Pelagibius sp.]|uniref:SDR family oxidoreductase n=1 Tax=Pelagibius sp. TaxID=1931238 RepID=UPI00260469F2|nr:SDR family oxidoreductase [Pelagibius sp.]
MGGPDLTGKHVVVVGGGSGIGRATAQAAAAQGARVTLSSRNRDRLAEVAQAIGGGTAAVPLDMTDPRGVAAWAGALGPLDHLVISASSAAHGSFAEMEMAALTGMFEAKFFGPYQTARAALPQIGDGGSITFFSGVLSRRPGLNCAGLGAVNGAVEGLTRALALELGPAIRVNCVSPGMVRSEAYAAMPAEARERMYEATGESLPLGRVGETDEVAQSVLFLMTNSFTTGVVLDVDGGHMVRQYATR